MTKTKAGRPRSEKAKQAVLNSTYELLTESGGKKLTIEAIAQKAGVGKPTIYRWWPSLADIVLEAVLNQADVKIPVPPYESLNTTLRQFLRSSMKSINEGDGSNLRYLMSLAQQDESFRDRFRENFVAKRQEILKSILRQAVDANDISSTQDLDMLVDLIFGSMWYRLLIGHGTMDEVFADKLTDIVIKLGNSDEVC
ncbi:TetR/AcrR family transcriptional regulator [Maridesulfovibrio salexigens]|uniref:Transcriptional regulator, TetR family n=1 Tax=Maridesulfovibrio salexigens (strain ATCC 14822 / DSM 2638 / NCIMB 8403 / VKM B-1763) TaxID=526222 RepID=C6BZN9_MARSD|nr:TetR/AcrR family transcriptional regulator [Maridesulfovibrio salexigens]ACS78946.1 transcriptional regulator, TetR family [Maridesulfovibrio salexigens DSM 2638]